MDRFQAIHSFWASFGIPAFNKYAVPDIAALPYLTYDTAIGSIDDIIPLNATIYYGGTLLDNLSKKTEEIYKKIVNDDPVTIEFEGGYLWIYKSGIFAQDMPSDSDNVKSKLITVYAEFITK